MSVETRRVLAGDVLPGDIYFGAKVTEVVYSEDGMEAILLATNPDARPVVFRLNTNDFVPVTRTGESLDAVMPIQVTTFTVQVVSREGGAPGSIYTALEADEPWLAVETGKRTVVYDDLAAARGVLSALGLDEQSVCECLNEEG